MRRCAWEEDWNDRLSSPDGLIEQGAHFFVFPRADSIFTDENGAGARMMDAIFEQLERRSAQPPETVGLLPEVVTR